MYAAANDILGNIVKVTPSSKVVGDLALHLVAVGADPQEFEEDAAEVRRARLGHRLPLRRARRPARRLARAVPHQGAGGPHREAGGRPSSTRTSAPGSSDDRRLTLNALLFPGPTKEFAESREKYGDVSVLPTTDYLYGLRSGEEHVVDLEEGKRLIFGLQAVSEPDERGIRTVMCTINGQLRPVNVRDRVGVRRRRRPPSGPTPRSPATSPRRSTAWSRIVVAEGDQVEAGATWRPSRR